VFQTKQQYFLFPSLILIRFGLNTLLRHKCQIDLQNMVLRFGDGTETPFLSEAEYTQEKDAVRQDGGSSTKPEVNSQQKKIYRGGNY
jgi:hypothetical protein